MAASVQFRRQNAELGAGQRETIGQLEIGTPHLSVLCDILRALNSIVDLDELLEYIIRRTKELMNAEGVSVIFHDQQRDRLYFPIVAWESDGIENQLRELELPIDSGVAGWVFREAKPALVPDVRVDRRFYGKIDKNTGFVTRSILCVPLISNEGIVGVLEVVNKKEGEFTEHDQRLLETIADSVAVCIERARLYRELQKAEATLRRQNSDLKQLARKKYRFVNIVGKSDKIIQVVKKAEQVALTDATVLICGETGTGKELVAQAIHYSSPRSHKSLVPINCGSIHENLLESELFGHEKGAFTGATRQRIGHFEEAKKGTLFLDEIGDMPLPLQANLLRVLQENVMRRLGGNRDIDVDARLIAATHRDLEWLVAEGKFRQDLYYRLKVFEIKLPPLRERKEDIPMLIKHFMAHYSKELGRQIVDIENAARDILCNYDYPGNIRELQNIIEGAMILSERDTITIDVLPEKLQTWEKTLEKKIVFGEEEMVIPRNDEELKAAKSEAQRRIERMFLTELLSATEGNVSRAAQKAGMNRSWISQLVSRNRLDLSQFRNGVS